MVTRDHWMTPESRGIYEQAESMPPPPQSHTTDDIGARMARLQEHIQWRAWDTRRVEMESFRRAADIVGLIRSETAALSVRLKAIEDQMSAASTRRQTYIDLLRNTGSAANIMINIAKYGVVLVLAVLFVLGKISVEGVRLFLGAIGFPVG